MTKILIVYSSLDNHTKKICRRLQQVIEACSHHVTVVSVNETPQVDLTVFDKIVVGGSVHYGKHSPLIIDFININRPILEGKPNAFFSVNLVARKPEKCIPENNPYLQKLLKRITWKPKELAVFAGKINYPDYSFFDRLIIQLIMLITKGPTDPTSVIEYTDWQQVESFGQRISEME